MQILVTRVSVISFGALKMIAIIKALGVFL